MRIEPAVFQLKPLRVHTLLADVPLHDVWALRLRGGGEGRTLRDFRELLSEAELQRVNPIVRGLFGLRSLLGRVFGWDDERHVVKARSFAQQLTDADRARSLEQPGEHNGLFRVVYTFENEALGEVVNRTVHALLSFAMEPTENGYTVYWAIYVKPVSLLTPFYMALIDPFRRLFVYPAIIKRIERTWSRRWQATTQAASR